MDISLKNLKVVISAGGSGIGKAILEGFHSQGAKIATCDINSDLIKILKDEYPEIYTEVLDVSDEQEVQSFCSNALKKLGGLDCLINNAGIAGPTSKIEEIDTADWFNKPIFVHQKLYPQPAFKQECFSSKPLFRGR